MTQSMSFSDLSANQKFDVTSSAYEQVVTMGKEVADKLKSNIQSATEAFKISIDLDVNVDKEKIASQIKEAIASAGNNAGEAIKLIYRSMMNSFYQISEVLFPKLHRAMNL